MQLEVWHTVRGKLTHRSLIWWVDKWCWIACINSIPIALSSTLPDCAPQPILVGKFALLGAALSSSMCDQRKPFDCDRTNIGRARRRRVPGVKRKAVNRLAGPNARVPCRELCDFATSSSERRWSACKLSPNRLAESALRTPGQEAEEAEEAGIELWNRDLRHRVSPQAIRKIPIECGSCLQYLQYER